MAQITDYPDDPKYTIKTVSSRTGILPVTLRAWERRYNLLNPHRLDNHYRLYSERDIAILRWIKNRVDQEVSISQAVLELRQQSEQGDWPEMMPAAPVQVARSVEVIPTEQMVRQLYQALVRHQEDEAAKLFQDARQMYDLTTLLFKVVVPVLVNIGDAWYRGEIRIATEHSASAFVRGKLMSILEQYPPRRNAAFILVGCAPTEQHEISSLMLAVVLRSKGYRVEYLGPDLPLDDLVDYARYSRPDMIILSAMMEPSALELIRFEEKLKRISHPPLFGFGGQAFVQKPVLVSRVAGIYLGRTLAEGVEKVDALVGNLIRTIKTENFN